ncbi:MAG: hypothetical protein WBD64_06840 [Candidatus Zixiibacteriota bacterium]
MNHIFDTEDEGQSSTQLKFLKTLIDKLIKAREHPTGATPSSWMIIFFYGEFRSTCGERRTIYAEFRSNLKIHFLTMKKMKNSHPHVPHVPHVPQVQPVGQNPQAPFGHGIHKGANTQRVLRHPLGRKAPFTVSFRTNLKIHFLTMKKMKNSHPHVPHVPQVQPVGQDPQAPFCHGIHKGENTQRVLRHPLGRPTTCSEYRFKRTQFFA